MEGRDGNGDGDKLTWWFSATNPQAPSSQAPPENQSSLQRHIIHGNPTIENNISQNFTSPNHFYLNPSSQNHFHGNHNPENLDVGYPFNQNPIPQNYFLQNPTMQNPTIRNQRSDIFYPMGIWDNSNNFDGQGLENSSSRLSQSAPPRQYQFPGNYSFSDSSQMSYPLENHEILDLESRLGRLKVAYDGGQPRTNSAAFGDNEYGNVQHTARRNLVAATNRYANNNINGFSLPIRYSNLARPNGIRFGLGSSISGGTSQSSFNASVSPSYRYNSSDFRARQYPNYSSMEKVRGRIPSVAKEQNGCCFLQMKVEERNPRDIEMILSEVQDDLHELTLHQVANYLIRKIIGVLNEEQMTKLILSIVSSLPRFFRICEDLNGSRVIQKLLDVKEFPGRLPLTPEQKTLLVTAIKNIAVALSKTVHGYHVIQRCLQAFPYQYTRDLLDEIADNCLNLATDKSGCCLLQHCILHAREEQKVRLIAEIVANALFLSEDSYGNYVVQYILGLRIPKVTNDIIAQLAGNFYALSQGKCSSNVVEKCLKESEEEQSHAIINELIRHPQILELMLHSYGNYVIQSAWMVSEGRRSRVLLSNVVQKNVPFLQSHIYGKRVLATVRGNKNRVYRRVSL